MARILGRAVLWGCCRRVLAPLAAAGADPDVPCAGWVLRHAGRFGGCEVGIANIALLMVPAGFVAGLLVTVVRRLIARAT